MVWFGRDASEKGVAGLTESLISSLFAIAKGLYKVQESEFSDVIGTSKIKRRRLPKHSVSSLYSILFDFYAIPSPIDCFKYSSTLLQEQDVTCANK